MQIIKGYLKAITVLTRLPVRSVYDIRVKSLTPYFPWVGAALGLAYAVLFFVFNLSPYPMAFVILLADVFITGGLHLDGFADVMDGIYSGKTGDAAYQVMKDSRIGAMGVIGLVFLLVGKLVLLGTLISENYAEALIWVLLIPWVGRIVLYQVIHTYPYPVGVMGFGSWIKEPPSFGGHILASVSILIPLIFMAGNYVFTFSSFYTVDFGPVALSLIFAVGLSFLMGNLLARQLLRVLNGVNGDGYGASCELAQLFFLLGGHIF